MTTTFLRKDDVLAPEQIVTAVERHEQDHRELRQRFEADYDLAVSGAVVTLPQNVKDTAPNFEQYVSNGPAAFLDKMVSWVSGAALKLQMEYGKDTRVERAVLDDAERFFYGNFQANDERLERKLELPLQDQLGWYACARGWLAGRSTLVKDAQTGETYADISPWDPLHTSWSVGSRGLLWICNRTKRTLGQVLDEYGGTEGQWRAKGSVDSGGEPELDIYDWWNGWVNAVVIGKEYAKQPTPHGSPRTPGFVAAVGPRPQVIRGTATLRSSLADYGESVFRSNRNLYDKLNFAMSVQLTLAALARSRAYTLTGGDGTTLPADNPYLPGGATPLPEGYKLELLPLLESGRDNQQLVQFILGEIQRGSIPFPAYGELGLAISGYAIKLLLQGIDSPLSGPVKAMNSVYRQITGLLKDQYLTGSFGPMELSGMDRNRKWFQATITPERLQGIGVPRVSLEANIPQDDMGKMQYAQAAREGPVPLFSDRWLRNYLGQPDTDLVEDEISEQEAGRLLPAARLFTLMRGAGARGDMNMAKLYYGELIRIAILQPGTLPELEAPMDASGGGGQGQGNGAKRNPSPETLPTARSSEAGGGAPPPQAGSLVAPGTPRPGAQGQPS